MKKASYFSAFSGIGAIERAVAELGNDWGCIGFSEIDKFAIQTYQKHFPHHHNFGDISKIKTKDLPDFDLFVGGFPCQSFSIAGGRLGFEDTRGTLFFDCARIIKAKQPKYFILENVRGLLSHDQGKTFRTIVDVLYDDLGYGIEYQILNSKDFGVPQSRQRVFIVGKRQDLIGGEKCFWHFDFPKPICSNKILFDILEPEVDLKYFLSDEQVSKILTSNFTTYRETINSAYELAGCLTATDYKRPRCVEITSNQPQGYRIYKPVVSTTLAAEAGGLGAKTGLYMLKAGVRRLTPIECERLQGFPDDWTAGVSNSQRYKQCGNAITVPVIKEILSKIIL